MNRQFIESAMKDEQNLAFLLSGRAEFSMTGYKVMQSQEKNGFVKCRKFTYNGKTELWYDIAPYRSLSVLLPELKADEFIKILSSVSGVMAEAEKNGFMHISNISLEFSEIFVMQEKMKPYLLYLPVQNEAGAGEISKNLQPFINEILSAAAACPSLKEEKIQRLTAGLAGGVHTISELKHLLEEAEGRPYGEGEERHTSSRLATEGLRTESIQSVPPAEKEKKGFFAKMFRKGEPQHQTPPEPEQMQPLDEGGDTELLGQNPPDTEGIRLVGVNTPEKCVLEIRGPEYKIGKKRELVDGCITCSKAVSRIHCKVTERGQRWYIEDMGSANGTFVNGTRLNPGREFPLRPDDRVKLANVEFRVAAG